jgi:hypothetical protein
VNSLLFSGNDKSRHAILNHFWDGTDRKGDDRSAARHGFDHNQTERFRPINREKQCCGIAQEILFGCVINLPTRLICSPSIWGANLILK